MKYLFILIYYCLDIVFIVLMFVCVVVVRGIVGYFIFTLCVFDLF